MVRSGYGSRGELKDVSLMRGGRGGRKAYEKVLGVDLAVLGQVEIFLGHENSLAEEILVDLFSIGFGNEPRVRDRYVSFTM